MKKLLLLLLLPFINNAQVVTISGFGTSETHGPGTSFGSMSELLNDTYRIPSEMSIPVSYTYIVDFSTNLCLLKNDIGEIVYESNFIVKSKIDDSNFLIEFTDPNNELENLFGIVVCNNKAAHYESNKLSVALTVFEAVFIR
jgi:hypothetical protein